MFGNDEALRDDPLDPQPEHSSSFLFVSVLLDHEAAAFAILPTVHFAFPFSPSWPDMPLLSTC